MAVFTHHYCSNTCFKRDNWHRYFLQAICLPVSRPTNSVWAIFVALASAWMHHFWQRVIGCYMNRNSASQMISSKSMSC